MKKVVNYMVISGNALRGLKSFELEIEAAIAEGWQPIGGVAFGVSEQGFPLWCQAIVKYEEDKPE